MKSEESLAVRELLRVYIKKVAELGRPPGRMVVSKWLMEEYRKDLRLIWPVFHYYRKFEGDLVFRGVKLVRG